MNNKLPQPIDPTVWFKPKTQDDILIEGITSGIKAAGVRGEDVTMLLIEALKSMGRKDLLPPCERQEKHNEDN